MKIITSHINLDFDGYASACLLTLFFKGYNLVFPGSKEEKVNHFVTKNHHKLPEELNLQSIRNIKLESIVVTDTSKCERLSELCEKIKEISPERLWTFDHHTKDVEEIFLRAKGSFIKERGSSTSIVVDFLKENGVKIPDFYATLGIIGIYEDTDFLSFSETRPEDVEAVAYLLRCGADLSEVAGVLKNPLTPSQIELLNLIIPAIEKLTVRGREVAVVRLSLNRYYSDVSSVIHRVMELENIGFFIAILQMEKKVYLIVKSNFSDIDLRDIFQGIAFGHQNAVSGIFRNKTVFEVEKMVKNRLENLPPLNRIKHIQSPPIFILSEDQTVKKAFEIFNRVKVNTLPVKDNEGRIIGYVSRQDIDYAISKGFEKVKTGNFVNRDIIVLNAEDEIDRAKRVFMETGVKLLFVEENGKITGLVTRTSALKHSLVVKDVGLKTTVNLRDRLKEYLPDYIYRILLIASDIASEMGVDLYIVGGFVRDLLLKKRNLDLDLVVSKDGMEFGKKLAEKIDAGVKVHDKFNTAKLNIGSRLRIDIATLRFEYYEMPGDLPRITAGSLFHDLYRRDFTINAMAVCLNRQRFGELIDYFNGRRDLKDRIIRVLHSMSFIDDPTRILRALRFKHRFRFTIGKTTESLMVAAANMNIFSTISGARYLKEFKQLFAEKNASFILDDFERYGCATFLKKDLKTDDYIKSIALNIDSVVTWYQLLYKKDVEQWLLYLMAILIHQNYKERMEIANKLFLKRKEKDIILNYRSFLREYSVFASSKERKLSEYYHFFKKREVEILLFALAFFEDEEYKKHISIYIDRYMDFKLKVNGKDAIKLGMKEGFGVKRVLDKLTSEVIDRGLYSREEQLKLLHSIVRSFKQ